MLLIPAVSMALRGGPEPFRGHLEATGVLQHVFIPWKAISTHVQKITNYTRRDSLI